MNNKGFSMIELLGVIVIIAVLAGVAIPAVYKYVGKTSDRAYDNIYESAFSAAEGKYMNDLEEGDTNYSIRDLYEAGYMDEPVDPSNKSFCDGEVAIKELDANNSEMSEYQYNVTLNCTGKCRSYYTGKRSNLNGSAC